MDLYPSMDWIPFSYGVQKSDLFREEHDESVSLQPQIETVRGSNIFDNHLISQTIWQWKTHQTDPIMTEVLFLHPGKGFVIVTKITPFDDGTLTRLPTGIHCLYPLHWPYVPCASPSHRPALSWMKEECYLSVTWPFWPLRWPLVPPGQSSFFQIFPQLNKNVSLLLCFSLIYPLPPFSLPTSLLMPSLRHFLFVYSKPKRVRKTPLHR